MNTESTVAPATWAGIPQRAVTRAAKLCRALAAGVIVHPHVEMHVEIVRDAEADGRNTDARRKRTRDAEVRANLRPRVVPPTEWGAAGKPTVL